MEDEGEERKRDAVAMTDFHTPALVAGAGRRQEAALFPREICYWRYQHRSKQRVLVACEQGLHGLWCKGEGDLPAKCEVGGQEAVPLQGTGMQQEGMQGNTKGGKIEEGLNDHFGHQETQSKVAPGYCQLVEVQTEEHMWEGAGSCYCRGIEFAWNELESG